MYWHTVNYKADRPGDVRGALVNRGFWLKLPRPLLACRARGHLPVVDGTPGFNGRPGYRWVCCDRCGVRPNPQGTLDPGVWQVGDRLAPLDDGVPHAPDQPGFWPDNPVGEIGGQLIVGGLVTTGIGFKVGNKGSEHTLAAHACLIGAGGLYLHAEEFGTWLQRRLNPVGYESRVTEVSMSDGRLYWQLWAPRDGGGRRGLPRWRNGSLRVDPRDILLGERRYRYEDAGPPELMTLVLPDGSSHETRVALMRQVRGRARGRKRHGWTADFDCLAGIPYRPGGGGMNGWSVEVSEAAVTAGMWQQEAAAATISKVAGLRVRYEYRDPAGVRP